MSLLLNAWLTLERIRRKRHRPPPGHDWAARHDWVRGHAAGRSFADVGGLYAVHGEVAFLAEDAGAERVTLLDAGDREYAFEFDAEHRRRGSAVRYVQGDLHDPQTVAQVGPHQVVWCTGVLYHSPNPFDQLVHLREITEELLYLGTHTIPEVPGAPQACLFYPHLGEADRRALSRPYGDAQGCVAIGTPFDDRPMHGYANFWWGITRSALRAMLRAARFEVVEERRTHAHPWSVDLVCRPVPTPPSLPPVDYYRRRREARDRGEGELPFEGFYEETVIE